MSATIHLESSLPKPSLPNDTCKLISALWGFRFAVNHEHGPAHITDVRAANTDWLKLVGDCVEWPLDLLDEFIKAGSEKEGKKYHGTHAANLKEVLFVGIRFLIFLRLLIQNNRND